MSKRRRIVPATELRIHLGEALKALDEEDIVVEKGGVPIAMLVRYDREVKTVTETATAYERALSKAAAPGGWERTLAAAERGWAGINEVEMTANIYRWRDEGATRTGYALDESPGEDQTHAGGEIPDRQRRLHQGDGQGTRVADERAEWDASGRAGD